MGNPNNYIDVFHYVILVVRCTDLHYTMITRMDRRKLILLENTKQDLKGVYNC